MTDSNLCECAFNNLKLSNILISKDMKFITSKADELKRCGVADQKHRTKFEMEYSVLSDVKFPTLAGKYFQCIREEMAMFSGLVACSDEALILQKKINVLKAEIGELGSSAIEKAQVELKQAEIQQMEYGVAIQKDEAHSRVREIKKWEEIKTKLTKAQNFDIDNVDSFQEEHWTKRWDVETNQASKHNLATFTKAKK